MLAIGEPYAKFAVLIDEANVLDLSCRGHKIFVAVAMFLGLPLESGATNSQLCIMTP